MLPTSEPVRAPLIAGRWWTSSSACTEQPVTRPNSCDSPVATANQIPRGVEAEASSTGLSTRNLPGFSLATRFPL
jgi:hypothetical protein